MSAYVVVEATVLDAEARDRYAPPANAVLKKFGGEVISFGPYSVLTGEPGHDVGMVIRFEDKDAALAWYNSPDYQALIEVRQVALDCRFRLIG